MAKDNANNQVAKNGKELVRDKSGKVVSGVLNPTGRPPKGYSITAWFKQMLASKPEVKNAIGKSIVKKALEGDVAAQRMVWNYMDGMPKQGEAPDQRIIMKLEYLDHESKTIGMAKPDSEGQA